MILLVKYPLSSIKRRLFLKHADERYSVTVPNQQCTQLAVSAAGAAATANKMAKATRRVFIHSNTTAVLQGTGENWRK